MNQNTNDSNLENKVVTKLNAITKCGQYLDYFLRQSKITRDYSFTELKKVVKQLKKGHDSISAINIEGELSYGKFIAIESIIKNYSKNESIFKNLRYDLIVRICSLYDTFLANIIKCILFDKSMVGLFDKALSLKEIKKFETHEDLIKYCIDIKVDDIFRKSHREQIEWIEKNFNIDIINNFERIEQIFLFFEMRNLIIHNNGIINRIYIDNATKCKLEKIPKIGDRLIILPDDLINGINDLFVFSIFIFSAIMGKLYNSLEDCETRDGFIINNVFELLVEKDYGPVIQIVDYCLKKNQKHVESDRLTLLLNKCIALKHLNNERYLDIIKNEDWSNCKDLFLLAKYCLIEDYGKAAEFMKKLGNSDEELQSYVKWPLFDWFRETDEFHKTFLEIFEVSFEDKLSQIASEQASIFAKESKGDDIASKDRADDINN